MTQLLYWNDTYLFESVAKIQDFFPVKDKPDQFCVVLDATIFYPQGGGQPSDTGFIKKDEISFQVLEVKTDPSGKVFHFGKFLNVGSYFSPGDDVNLNVDEEKRRLNSKLHSAGHLLDVAVQNLGLKLVPGKGYHFPQGPYVEYSGDIPAEERNSVLEKLQQQMNDLIKQGFEVKVESVPYDEVAAKCGLDAPPNYLPAGKPARIITVFGTIGCPCAGTHVKNVSEIGSVSLKKMTVKKGVVRLSYTVE